MNEENQTTKVKKSGKAKKIIIAVVAVIVVFLPTFTSNPSIVTSSISYFVIVNVAFAVYAL